MDRRPEPARCEGIPLHLRLQPRHHWLGVGNGGFEELVLRTERVENHVAVGKHLVAWIRQESSKIRYLWRLTDSEVSSFFSRLAYPCNKVAVCVNVSGLQASAAAKMEIRASRSS